MSPPDAPLPAPAPHPAAPPAGRGSAGEVLGAFLRLGLTSFGGPVAHLGYFRTEFVERRRWLSDRHYGDLVALCQFLPGPTSSQVGMALGLQRAGAAGALAAWLGFTLPSVVALVLLAQGLLQGSGLALSGVVHGLKIAALAIVVQALWGMARSLCPDRRRGAIAVATAMGALALPGWAGHLGAIALGALLGRYALPAQPTGPALQTGPGLGLRSGALLLGLAAALLLLLPALATRHEAPALQAVAGVYQAGALVFGGGHVVLPLLQTSLVPPGWISTDSFLAGYGAAQAVPGPLFSLAAYLGASTRALWGDAGVWSGWLGALVLTTAVFLPGLLLAAGALPFWATLRQRTALRQALAGVNAAVVGVLGAALYDPVWTSAIHAHADLVLALAAWGLLVYARLSPLWVVLLAAGAGWALGAAA